MRILAHFNAQRLSEQALERLRVTAGSPELEFGIAAGANLQQAVLAAIVKIDTGHRLRMAAVEALRHPQDRRQGPDDTPAFPWKAAVAFVAPFRRRLPMIPRNQCDRFDLVGIEAA